MYQVLNGDRPKNKTDLYLQLTTEIYALLDHETDWIANSANVSSLLYHSLPEINWAGFYFMRNGELVVGPFQGKPACVRIEVGRGVCGTAARNKETVVVRNVHEFPGHIACDSRSRSEIVVPLKDKGGNITGVFDIDSKDIGSFDETDQVWLERIVGLLC